jgi:hypothetical protein
MNSAMASFLNINKHHHPDFVPTTYDFAQERYWEESSLASINVGDITTFRHFF